MPHLNIAIMDLSHFLSRVKPLHVKKHSPGYRHACKYAIHSGSVCSTNKISLPHLAIHWLIYCISAILTEVVCPPGKEPRRYKKMSTFPHTSSSLFLFYFILFVYIWQGLLSPGVKSLPQNDDNGLVESRPITGKTSCFISKIFQKE